MKSLYFVRLDDIFAFNQHFKIQYLIYLKILQLIYQNQPNKKILIILKTKMNNSSNIESIDNETKRQNRSTSEKSLLSDVQLTSDQHIILQHYLPKGYVLLQLKPTAATRRGPSGNLNKNTSVIQEKQNVSKLSGNLENASELDFPSKRSRLKKVDRYLDQQLIKQQPKRSVTQKIQLDDQMIQCLSIVNSLKKHRSANPFLYPVDPLDGATNYFQIIKQPMDLSTIEKSLKQGQYQTSGQFHGDISKIWFNSYAYNQKTSQIYKMTIQMQKYYKNLLANDNILNKTTSKLQKSKTKQKKAPLKADDKRKRKSDSKVNVNMSQEEINIKDQIVQHMDIEEKKPQSQDLQDNQEEDYDGYN